MNTHSAAYQVVSFLLDWAVRGGALAAVAGLATLVFRIRDVRTRLALWIAVLCGSLALPAVRPFMPSLLPAPEVAAAPVLASPARVTIMPRAHRVVRRVSSTPVARQSYAAPAPMARPFDWSQAALGMWAAGLLFLLARLITGLWLTRRVIRAAVPVEDATRHMRGLRVLETPRVTVPMTAGVLRPVVLLPQDWREWDGERLRAVLAHERSHVERRDGLVRVLAQMHRAALWFSPAAWWLQNHLRDLGECASDDSALAETVDRSAYAEVVLHFFRAARKRVVLEGLAMAGGGSAERRIDRILAGGPLGSCVRRSALVAVLTLTVGCVGLLAALQAPPPPKPSPMPSPATAPAAVPDAPRPPAAPALAPLPAPPEADDVEAPEPPEPPEAPDVEAPEPPEPPEPPEAPGEAWVLFRGNSQTMSGNTRELRDAIDLHNREKQDMLWIRHGDKAWVIRDAELLRRAGDAFRTVQQFSGKEEELNQQMEALNRVQEDLERNVEKMRGRMPQVEEDLKQIEEKLREKEPTADQLSELQDKLAEMQSRLAEAQERMNGKQEEINRKMEELAQKQVEIGRQQETSGQAQEKAAAAAERAIERLMEDAIRTGRAKPAEPAR